MILKYLLHSVKANFIRKMKYIIQSRSKCVIQMEFVFIFETFNCLKYHKRHLTRKQTIKDKLVSNFKALQKPSL